MVPIASYRSCGIVYAAVFDKRWDIGAADMGALNNAHKLSGVKDISEYKAVFIPGGHGDHPESNPNVAVA